MTARLAVVMSGFPRTSETFALGELVALARSGMLVRVYATKPGDGETPQPGVEEVLPLLRMLPEADRLAFIDDVLDDYARLDGDPGGPRVFVFYQMEVALRRP